MREKNKHFMLRAIALARKAKGKTFPNPMVGAVVVKGGEIVGEGYHKKAGTPHAEVIALRASGEQSEGAELYVSLEPCAHYGKTPPCVKDIVESGVKKVYVAMRDPNPLVNGKGVGVLRENGITVKTGICRREAVKLNGAYIESIEKKGS